MTTWQYIPFGLIELRPLKILTSQQLADHVLSGGVVQTTQDLLLGCKFRYVDGKLECWDPSVRSQVDYLESLHPG